MLFLPLVIALVLSFTGSAIASTKSCANNNDLMRCFLSSTQLATPFCSSFLSIPTATFTYTATTTSYLTLPTLATIETDVIESSEFITSYTPVVVTTTLTSTTTLITDAPANIAKREPKAPAPKPSPTTLACLSALTAKLAHSSTSIALACSCLSVKTSTTSVTSTQYVTATSFSSSTETTTTTTIHEIVTILPSTTIQTAIAMETDSTSCFGLTISSASDSSLIGQVLALTASDYDPAVGQLTHFTDPSSAEAFYLSSASGLVSGLNGAFPGQTAAIAPGSTAYYIQFMTPADKAGYGLVNLVCGVDHGGTLACRDASGEGDDLLEYCADLENHLLIANYQYDPTCVTVTLRTVPMSCHGVD